MQSHQLRRLVEEAGPEFVGVNFDSGNACWTLENPVHALRTLAPYMVTTSLRDTTIWESAEGVMHQPHHPLIGSEMPVDMVPQVRLTELSLLAFLGQTPPELRGLRHKN
jgi:hypothetical protein